MNIKTKDFIWQSAKRGNSETFADFLLRVKEKSKKAVLIVDNVSYHKSKQTKSFVEKLGNITLKYLPTYSPEYNPIEMVWKFAKASIRSGKVPYKNITELLSKLKKYIELNLDKKGKINMGVWRLLFRDIYAV